MSEFGRFFLPGPVEVHPDILAAFQRPMISPWSPEAKALLDGLQPGLRRLFRTRQPVLLTASSSTGLLEGVIRSAVPRRALAVCGGFFGERLAETLEACGREAVRLQVHPGRTIEPAHLEQFLGGPPVDAVLLVHSETSTGALAPLAELARTIRTRTDALIIVDAVSSVGAVPVETDAWGLDFVFTGSQKALAMPPGLGLGVASARLLKRAAGVAGRGWYLDLLRYEEATASGQPTQTPALSHLYALELQLARIDQEGGMESRWSRHAAMLTLVERWIAISAGWRFLADPGRRSPAVSAIVPPPGVAVPFVLDHMRSHGFTLTGGLGPLRDKIVRIGHMGDVTPAAVERMLEALATSCRAQAV
ncbi:MAG TPA: alanine--glyoxylate aminotransferase family protein [Gemmatimonadales bacterium]|nr:alanine--glyoxylate aminotransferase family protein [Gemmatimonadales bacterium]